jgi:hypothetical protein
MSVRLPALSAGLVLPPSPLTGRFLVLITVRGRVNIRATLQLQGLGKLEKKNLMI